jgi:hypothetical protein
MLEQQADRRDQREQGPIENRYNIVNEDDL